ncbi:MAG: NrfD/PsrC family molybdoenzyme membrane anchor subunit, partial [Terriglobales bacterium]
ALLPDRLGGSDAARVFAVPALIITLALHVVMMLGEMAMPHTTDNSRYAARLITHGPFSRAFWAGAIAAGGILPLLIMLVAPHNTIADRVAAILALAGLLIFEWCFVMAGQSVPNS